MADIISAKSSTGDDVPAFVTPDGELRLLTSLPGNISRMATPYAAANPVIDRKDWAAFDRTQKSLPIYNQGQIGSCVANGWLYMVLRAMRTANASPVELSRAMLYALINGGRDAGADPAAAAEALATTGVCLESEMPYRFATRRQIPAQAFETAKRFRLEPEAIYACENFDEVVSAELMGCDAGFTVRVGNGFNNMDADGCPAVSRGVGNHWMSFDNRLKRNARGEWFLGALQSWSTQWADGGRCWMREAHFSNQPYCQLYAVKWAPQDPLDPKLPPVARVA